MLDICDDVFFATEWSVGFSWGEQKGEGWRRGLEDTLTCTWGRTGPFVGRTDPTSAQNDEPTRVESGDEG